MNANQPNPTRALSGLDRLRIAWTCARYDLWLDLRFVSGKQRKALRSELRANLTEAAADQGVGPALAGVGSVRQLSAETVRDGELRSRWYAGSAAAFVVLVSLLATYLFLTLYYAEGVLDAGATEPVRSSLFPYLWSSATVDPSNGGLSFSVEPGPVPFIVAAVVFLAVAKPWRSIRRSTSTTGVHVV